jgi:hypothetical protein
MSHFFGDHTRSHRPAYPDAAPRWDIICVADATVKELENSNDPRLSRLGFTIANAQLSFKHTIEQGGRIIAITSKGNDGEPVLVVVPPGYDPAKPTRVNTFYHGDLATVADPPNTDPDWTADTTTRIESRQEDDPQTLFILPECRSTPPVLRTEVGPDKARYQKLSAQAKKDPRAVFPLLQGSYTADWSNVSSQKQTTHDALAALDAVDLAPQGPISYTVSAFSRGGDALCNAISKSPDGSGLRCDRLELLDCLRNPAMERVVLGWAKTSNGRAVHELLYLYEMTPPHFGPTIRAAFAANDISLAPHLIVDSMGSGYCGHFAAAHNLDNLRY